MNSKRRTRAGLSAVLAAGALAAGCGGATVTHTASSVPPATRSSTAAPAPPPPPPPPPRKPKPPPPSPGSLPQTDRRPSADTRQFRHQMARLWDGIRRNSVRPALAAFFPEGAYRQLKTVGDPKSDFEDRLVADFKLDIGAARALVADRAQLIGVKVPDSYAHWVPPGVCDNRVGYYEVPNSRLVYRQGGVVHSFGIASMISWRGVWYVVHLGSVLRPVVEGVVDAPTVGPGESAPSSTC